MRNGRLAWVWWLLAGTGLAILVSTAACGGGGERLSAEEYFGKLQAIAKELDKKGTAISPNEEELANQTPEQRKQTAVEFLKSFAPIVEDGINKVDDLDPPDDIQDDHEDLVQAGKDLVKAFNGFVEEVEAVPPEGIEDFFNTNVFAPSTFAAFDEACLAVQKIADDKNIDVDLNCTEE